MTGSTQTMVRAATEANAMNLAKLIDIAGEGIPTWIWSQSATDRKSPLEIGVERARRENGGFSYRNAMVAQVDGAAVGMVLSYPIDMPSDNDPGDLPAPVAPFVALERQAVGTWYINALSVFPEYRGMGLGKLLLNEAEIQARQRGYERMSIQVYAQNQGAVRLYTRVGYGIASQEPVRDHPCQPYYTGDVLLLTKRLA